MDRAAVASRHILSETVTSEMRVVRPQEHRLEM